MKKISINEVNLISANRQLEEDDHTFSWKLVLMNSNLLALVIAFFFLSWGIYFFISWMPTYLQEGRHFTENQMKNFVSLFFMIGIVGALLSGYANDWLVKKKGVKFARKFLGIFGLGILSLSFFVAAITTDNNVVMFSLYIGHFFSSMIGIVFFSTCIDIGGKRAGTIAGIMNFFGQIGAFFLAVLFGKIVDVTHNFNAPLFLISFLLFLGCMLWLVIDPTKKVVYEKNTNIKLAITG